MSFAGITLIRHSTLLLAINQYLINCSQLAFCKIIAMKAKRVSVQRNIEQAYHTISSNEDEVQIIDSELLLTLCGSCGNAFHYDVIARIIETIPINSSSLKEN